MLDLNITLDEAQVRRAQRLLRAIPNGFEKAASRALNKTARRIRTKFIRELVALTRVKTTTWRQWLVITKANRRRLWVELWAWNIERGALHWGGRKTPRGYVYYDWDFGQEFLVPGSFLYHDAVWARAARKDTWAWPEPMSETDELMPRYPIYRAAHLVPSNAVRHVFETGTTIREVPGLLDKDLGTQIDLLLQRAKR